MAQLLCFLCFIVTLTWDYEICKYLHLFLSIFITASQLRNCDYICNNGYIYNCALGHRLRKSSEKAQDETNMTESVTKKCTTNYTFQQPIESNPLFPWDTLTLTTIHVEVSVMCSFFHTWKLTSNKCQPSTIYSER